MDLRAATFEILEVMAAPLHSGLDWEEDPEGNANSHEGRTVRYHVRARSDPSIQGIAKRPQDRYPLEIYSIGMERVAYRLADALDLPVMPTHLDDFDGHPCCIQLWIPQCRSWRQAGAAPMMRTTIHNQDVWAKAALFDVWLSNVDRRDVNLAYEPMPAGTLPARATSCRLWLIDHGYCGLYPADKLEQGRDPYDIPAAPAGIDGSIRDAAEKLIGALMPPEYRKALKDTQGPSRQELVDAVRSVGDDVITEAVEEIPEAYMTGGQRAATVAFLTCRLSKLGTVLEEYW